MANTMKAAVFEKIGVVKVKEVPIPEIGDNDVLIKVKLTGICGTDWSIYNGWYSADKLPMIPGHEFSGVIAKLGKNAKGLKEGDRVTIDPSLSCGECINCKRGLTNICLKGGVLGCHKAGALCDYICVDYRKTFLLPDGISLEEGAMAEPAAVGVHAARKAGVADNQNILIFGSGTIGLMVLQACKVNKTKVLIIDPVDARLKIARNHGADYTAKPEVTREQVKNIFGEDGIDTIFICVGNPKTIDQAFSLARKGTRLIVLGGFNDNAKMVPATVQFCENDMVGCVIYTKDDFGRALDYLKAGIIKVRGMITHKFALEEIDRAYNLIKSRPAEVIKVLVTVNKTGGGE